MPHAGHLIVGNMCRFHLTTYVGGYIVSTVGEYLPDHEVLKIYAESRNYPLTLAARGDAIEYNFLKENGGYEDIGFNRKYETMVFRATRERGEMEQCCPWTMFTPNDLDMEGYTDGAAAMRGHLKMCLKYSKKK